MDCCGSENFIHDDDCPRRRLIENIVNSYQTIFQFAAEILDLLFFFKMREQLIEKEELRRSSGNGTTDAGHIVQLAEGTSEGGFAALIGTGYDRYPFFPLQVEVVAYNRRALPNKLFGQSDIESVMVVDFLALVGNTRIAELKTRLL